MKIMTESSIKYKSVLMLTLILLAPIFVLITLPVAHAASPSISLSVSSGTGNAVTTGVKITGTGFPGLKSTTGIKLYFISTGKTLSVSGATQVDLYGQSLRLSGASVDCGSSTSGTCPPAKSVSVDGSGNFIAFFNVPSLAADTYNVFVSYTPSGGSDTNSSPVAFTIAPYLDVRLAKDDGSAAVAPTTRSAHFGQWVRVLAYGFGASETVTVTGLPVPSGTTLTLTSTSTGATDTKYAHFIGETTAGSKTFTAVGGTSGVTATRSFTINPTIAVYSSQTSTTQVSIPAGAPNTAYVELHGFANAETISSATIGGGTASFGSVTTSTSGSYGVGGGAHLALLYTNSLSYGLTSITITGSKTGTVTFNAANGNVINPYAATGTTSPNADGTLNLLNTPILASTGQASGTSIVAFDSSSGSAGGTLTLYLTGWGASTTMVLSAGASSGVKFGTTGLAVDAGTGTSTSGNFDANGAMVVKVTVPDAFRGSHTIAVTAASGATNPGTAWTVKPLLYFFTYNNSDDAAGYAAFTNAGTASTYGRVLVSGSGFGADTSTSESLSLTIGTHVVDASFISSVSSGNFSRTAISTGLPDLAAGSYKVTASGATTGDNATGIDYYSATQLISTVTDLVVVSNFYLPSALSAISVTQGRAVVLQTSSTSGSEGIHGLKPSSSYEVRLDGPTGTLLTTFTSTSGGAVPAGTQFVVPAASSGVHIIDIVQSGASVVIGKTVNLQAIGSTTLEESTYGKLFINLSGSITVNPSAGNAGSVVTIGGTGLAASTSYSVQLASNGIAYASFTTTSSGAIPAGVSFTFPAIAIGGDTTAELGRSFTINLLNTATNNVDSTGTFLLQAHLTVAPSTAAPSASVKASATGLKASIGYNIVWDAALNSNGLTTGTIVGSFTSGGDGTGSSNFTIPAAAASGSHSVSLLRTNQSLGATGITFRLVTPATVTVSIGGAVLQGTSTLTASGAATQINLSGAPALQITYNNNVASAVTGIVYAVVHNAAGQTVYYTTATITPGAGATVTAYLILAGLPSGTYSVTLFAVTPSGVAISATSTATATI